MSQDLIFEVKDNVATIRLNRPEKLNAFTGEMLSAWHDALEQAEARDDVSVVVLTGTGRGFCSGGDVGSFAERHGVETAFSRKQSLAHRVHRIPLLMERMEKPVIVAVNGVAAGAGMDMALMGDIRVAARSARFAETYVRMGIFAGDGGAWYLPRIVGVPMALELLFTGRFVESDEAKEIGLVNRVVADDELMTVTYEMAQHIAAQPPLAIRMMKRAVYQSMRIDLKTHLDLASSHMGAIFSTEDHKEAVTAFREKRKPVFRGY